MKKGPEGGIYGNSLNLRTQEFSPWEDPIKLGFNPAPSRAPPRTLSSL